MMFKKLKERVSSNDNIQLVLELWSNKKTRSLVGLIAYMIFFIILIGIIRANPIVETPNSTSEMDKIDDVKVIISNLETKINTSYDYKLFINNVEINGKFEKGTNTFEYENRNYVFVYNKLYLNNNNNLELVNNFLDSEIPIEIINIDSILEIINEKTISNSSIIDDKFELIYEISALDILNITNDDLLVIKIIGNDNITDKIVINYNNKDYILELVKE